MKVVATIIGAVVGFAVVRGFFFTGMEELGFRFFMHFLFEGQVAAKAIPDIIMSATAMKLFAGVIVGGYAGYVVGGNLENK